MSEWLSGNTINGILSLWETPTNHSKCQQNPLSILNYNVQGWGTRALEAVELIFNSDSSIGIFTEVGELWKDFTIPHFKSFYQKGTNSKGGVVVAVGKHLKATRIDTNIENTVIVDVEGLTEQIRIIGIYWPQCQPRNLEDLTSYISEKTILTGDFNASAQEWQSPMTDARGNQLKKWIEKNNLLFIPGTKNSSKRSDRHIDLIFTNIEDAEAETLNTGTRDHWPIVMKSDRIGFRTDGNFPVVNWTVFQIVLALLQDFWTKESEIQDAENWYLNYTRFLSALKNRVTKWSNRNRYRPSLPPYIVGMLKQVRRVRNKYYRERKTNFGVEVERTRLLLRTLTKQVKNEVYNYKSERWNAFLSTIQESHDRNGKHFWSHLSKIYKPKTLPISKLKAGSITIAHQQEITNMLYSYYKEQANSPTIDESEKHDQKIVRDYNKIMNTLSQPLDIKVEKVTSSEVTKIIKKLKNKKSSGYDQISNYIIKLLPPAYIDCLVKCFNVWLSEGRYPDFWKLAKIITLNKLNAGVPRPDQTRPISLLATHSKLFEKVLLERVSNWAEGAQLVPIEQSGFRQGGLIATRVLSIYQEIQNNLAANMPTLALYVDYRKAYDMVWHAGLLVKLHDLGMPIALLKMTASWLGNRQAYIAFGDKVSEKYKIDIGLPQGSSLSPFLFIVYHCDLIQCLGAHSGHMFADDLSVLITAPITKSLATIISYLEEEGTEDLHGRAKCH
ncbi:unnamed protein product [Rotaria magnacalcarata]